VWTRSKGLLIHQERRTDICWGFWTIFKTFDGSYIDLRDVCFYKMVRIIEIGILLPGYYKLAIFLDLYFRPVFREPLPLKGTAALSEVKLGESTLIILILQRIQIFSSQN
jgi:hypothetical protein